MQGSMPRHLFRDRADAGAFLAGQLAKYAGHRALVLGIPRGGVPVAAEVARSLDADLDVVVARKLRAPGAPEYAIGAVTADGARFLNDAVVRELAVPDEYLAEETAAQTLEARRREARFRGSQPPAPVKGRTVIVVDDGLATGATMHAAVNSLRKRGPARLVVAVPVGSRQACAALGEEADEVVCPRVPEPFFAVGEHYLNFAPTEDEEVMEILRRWRTGEAEATR
jgi:putative phosphoribosyl transferase